MTTQTIESSTASETGNAWTQTRALLVDAYRDLQSRKLFWLTLVLSFLVAGIFVFVGIDQDGITIFGKRLSGIPFNSNLIAPADFFKLIFTTFGIPVWLGFLSAALALVAVGGIFPDAITSGSIDLYLSRPIGRLRLFLTKYTFALLFTSSQVLVFSVVSFLVIGYRGGAWEFRIFLAVPLVTLFFSYIYCVCTLIGILTRSTLASILITTLFWGALYIIHVADVQLVQFSAAADQRIIQQERVLARNEQVLADNAALPVDKRSNMTAFEFQRDRQKEVLAGYQQTADNLHWWRDLVMGINTPLPKTNETVQLMSRWLLRPGVLDAVAEQEQQRRTAIRAQRGGPATRPRENVGQFVETPEVQQQVEEELGARHVIWIIGTSLGFEALVLGLAGWVFCRRDY